MADENSKLLTPRDITGFWLGLEESAYWKKDVKFDALITNDYGKVLKTAKLGEMDHWCEDREGVLALTIVLDQFSRNIHRGTPEMFAADEHARTVANYAIRTDMIDSFNPQERRWFIMPYMHTETVREQRFCVALCKRYKLEATLPHAIEHMKIVKEFGRFPHRNDILGRQSTDEELAFLSAGGFAG
ncbi:hypothetical protein MNBD_ALPHA08-1396 [hydrothermal vent metagenome]|uniref:DUF924 domain-containing protein n=1 Tax=hydrothermal vent metagenome TaxID=652676 RepID=A0A3B0R5S8_9ZZZZ